MSRTACCCWLRRWVVVGITWGLCAGGTAADEWKVHEWGTFTCLQDEAGRAIAGVNTDDEPLPRFVHRLADSLIFPPSEIPLIYYKGVPMLHPQVTMRLETPVIYFYPPAGAKTPQEIDVRVRFRGGWLSEYYPDALVQAPGIKRDQGRLGVLTSDTVGSLSWRGLQVGVETAGPATDYHVWLAPRQVRAAGVRTQAGEDERYLFYRGVGHVEAPLRVYRDEAERRLVVNERFGPDRVGGADAPPITTLWLVDIRRDGAIAFREIARAPLTGATERTVAAFPSEFRPAEYNRENLARLRALMKQALVSDGLFDDEAEAMLNTWELGYFKSAGLRLFFLLPRAWTDDVLPLNLSHEADVVRTLVGRIELVTPEHRRLLARIAQAPLAATDWYNDLQHRLAEQSADFQQLWEGRLRFADLDLKTPPEYRDYLALGRFRNALILDALAQQPNSGLKRFAVAYRLRYYTPEE